MESLPKKLMSCVQPDEVMRKPVKFDALGENGAAAAFVFQWQKGNYRQVLPSATTGSVPIAATKPPWNG